MTTTISTDASVMHWRSPLVRMTLIPQVGILAEGSTICWVDPAAIISVRRAMIRYRPLPDVSEPPPPPRPGTWVTLCGGVDLHVEESPDEVANLRNRAFGHELSKPRVA